MKVKHPTDVITWKMTQEHQWQLGRIESAIYGLSEVANNDDFLPFYQVMKLINADLSNVMDEIRRLNAEEKQSEENGGAQ